MRLSRTLFLAVFLPLALGISLSCKRMTKQLLWKQELVETVEPVMYFFEYFQSVTGFFLLASVFCLIEVASTQNNKLLNLSLVYQMVNTIACLLIMGLVLYARYPSLKSDEDLLMKAMSDYGNEDIMTKMMDTTQSHMECCGVIGLTDWKKMNATYPGVIEFTDGKPVDATYLNQSISYKNAPKDVTKVPVTCATLMNKTHMQFHTRGCLVPLFVLKEQIAYRFLVNLEILALYELAIVVLVFCILITDYEESDEEDFDSFLDSIVISFMESDAVANAEGKEFNGQYEDVVLELIEA